MNVESVKKKMRKTTFGLMAILMMSVSTAAIAQESGMGMSGYKQEWMDMPLMDRLFLVGAEKQIMSAATPEEADAILKQLIASNKNLASHIQKIRNAYEKPRTSTQAQKSNNQSKPMLSKALERQKPVLATPTRKTSLTPGTQMLLGAAGMLLIGSAMSGASEDGGLGGGGGGGGGSDDRGSGTSEWALNWGLGRVNPHSIHSKGFTGKGVYIGLMDTGIDDMHGDLQGQVDLEKSFNYMFNNNVISDYHGHGTHVGSIMAGKKDGKGMMGIAPDAKIISMNVITPKDKRGFGYSFGVDIIADGYKRVIDGGAFAVNNSWGFSGNGVLITDFDTLQQALNDGFLVDNSVTQFKRMVEKDMINVFAAGNDGASQVGVMAGMPILMSELKGHWVAVVSTNSNNTISSFSNKCGVAKNFCIAAPGENITAAWSKDARALTGRDGSHITMSGTSMAAPHVTGSLALLKSAFPEKTAPELLNIIFETATDLGAEGTDAVYGRGLLNLREAMSPQGTLTLALDDSTSGRRVEIEKSYIQMGAGIDTSIAKAMKNDNIIVMDKYDRGFKAGISSFVSTNPTVNSAERGLSLSNMSLDSGKTFELYSGAKVNVKQDRSSQLVVSDSGVESVLSVNRIAGFGFEEEDQTAKIMDNTKSSGHIKMLKADIGMSHSFAVTDSLNIVMGQWKGGFKNAPGKGVAEAVGMQMNAGSMEFELSVGKIRENGSTLGGVSAGAFAMGDTVSDTRFTSIGAKLDIGNESAISFGSSTGFTDFRQTGLITGGSNIKTTSLSIGFAKKGILSDGDSFAITASRPVTVNSGTVYVDMPVGRSAAVSGVSSNGVERKVAALDIGSADIPLDIEVNYAKPLTADKKSMMNFGAMVRDNAGQSDIAAKFGVSLKF